MSCLGLELEQGQDLHQLHAVFRGFGQFVCSFGRLGAAFGTAELFLRSFC